MTTTHLLLLVYAAVLVGAGLWVSRRVRASGDFFDRFAPVGYHSDDPGFSNEFEAQCRRTKAAGIDAIEIHQHVFEKELNGDLDFGAMERARDGFLPELGMTITACNINTWTNPRFRLLSPASRSARDGSSP